MNIDDLPADAKILILNEINYGPILANEDFDLRLKQTPRIGAGIASARKRGKPDRRIVFKMRSENGRRAEYHATKGWRIRSRAQ